MNPKTIVSVIESSPAADDAPLTRALALARRHRSHLHVVAVGPPSRGAADGASAFDGGPAWRRVRDAATGDAGGVAITPVALAGPPVPALADYVRRVAADLVVVGTGPRRRDGYWSAGAFAAAVGAAVPAPTMTIASDAVAPGASRTAGGTILAAIDFPEVSLSVLQEALALADAGGGRLRILHVLDGYEYDASYSGAWALSLLDDLDARIAEVRSELRSLLWIDGVTRYDLHVVPASGARADAIVDAAAEASADLIVMGRPRWRRLEHLRGGTTAHKVVRRAPCPVLLVPGASTVRLPTLDDDRALAGAASAGDWAQPPAAVAAGGRGATG